MRNILVQPGIGILFVVLFSFVQAQEKGARRSLSQSVESWPFSIPARTHDGPKGDLFVMTLGKVSTPLADGKYDPARDEVELQSGKVLKNYYRDSLKVSFFKPIDKKNFPLPPSGWCSWYYYYQEVNEDEIRTNAKWIAENLKDFGAEYAQIDDGWQGTGHGGGENRDWTTTDKRFRGGMSQLAHHIKALGLKPGLWLAPHGQSSLTVATMNRNAFLWHDQDSSASSTWEGKYLLDPSTPESHRYLRDLFGSLSKQGYEYFKIDGQPIVVDEYRSKKSFMKNPADDVNELYRGTLRNIRSAIGDQRYLLGCWGVPLEGVGIMNGSRTGGDVLLGWDGFMTAVDATMKYYFLHNIAWYCDPDVMLLRAPLPVEQARAWATLQGLTGQALMASDRLPDLSAERIEIMKRVFPALDVRPLDLFPSLRTKHVWDLKVKHLSRSYDVVGLFNFDREQASAVALSWTELGLDESKPVHIFDFWNDEYLGSYEKGFSVEIAPASCRVLTLLPATDGIQLISTNRHITQGWIDLLALSYDAKNTSFTGVSKVIANDAYELCFVFPRNKNFVITSAAAQGLPVKVLNHQGWALVRVTSPRSETVSWKVRFEPSGFYSYPVKKPYDLSIEPKGIDAANVRWSSHYYLYSAYSVYGDGELLGSTTGNVFPLRNIDPRKHHRVEVRTLWENGESSPEGASAEFTPSEMIPRQLALADVEALRSTIGWGTVAKDKSVSGSGLSVGGERFQRGIGTHADSELEYHLYGLFDTLTAKCGVDDGAAKGKGSVEFTVLADDVAVWRSGVMRYGDLPKEIRISLRGRKNLVLRVTNAGDGIDNDHADWCDAMLTKQKQ